MRLSGLSCSGGDFQSLKLIALVQTRGDEPADLALVFVGRAEVYAREYFQPVG